MQYLDRLQGQAPLRPLPRLYLHRRQRQNETGILFSHSAVGTRQRIHRNLRCLPIGNSPGVVKGSMVSMEDCMLLFTMQMVAFITRAHRSPVWLPNRSLVVQKSLKVAMSTSILMATVPGR